MGANCAQLIYAKLTQSALYLERQGLLERDVEGAWLTSCAGGGENEATLDHVLGSSVTYRIAIGPQAASAISLRRPILMEPRM